MNFFLLFKRTDAEHVNVQRPISIKIFSIALGLLLLMALVTMLSTRNLARVNDEVGALAEFYIPLSHQISQMEVDVRSQVIHLERLILIHQRQEVDSAGLKLEQAKFEQFGHDVQLDVATAMDLVAQASISAKTEGERIELARLEPMIRNVGRAHEHLEASVLDFLAEVRHGNQQAVHILHRVIVEERTNFDAETKEVRKELQKFTEASALKARSLEQDALRLNWGITLAAGLLGLVFTAILTRNLVKPVRRLLQGTRSVEQGNLTVQLQVTSADEIAALTQSFNHMVTELRQKELIKDTFGKYVDPRIVKGILEDQQFDKGGERRAMTVMFSDLQGFTTISERLTPTGVVKLLNQYFTMMSEPIRRHNGILDKFIGDAIMAFWGPPFTSETEHPTLACLAALEQLAKLDEFTRLAPEILNLRKGLPPVNMRIGLATGDVTVGNIGSDTSRGYTVIGDTVNLASRLESANKQYGTNLLISEETWKMSREAVETRELDAVRVVGKSDPVRIFELLAVKGGLAPERADLRGQFEQALEAYRHRDWDKAQAGFEACLQLTAQDKASTVFLTRITHLREHPPAADWDGAWSLEEK